MPGITGIIGGVRFGRENVERMTRCMLHESSYVSGFYSSQDVNLCVGWVSHPHSFSDRMPLWNERRDICLIFSGEDFADEPIPRTNAPARNYSAGSGHYLLSLYEREGSRFVEKLNGWFTGLLIDLRRKSVILFNDRFGLGRIYYHETPERFYFSSEAKCLLEVVPSLRCLDQRGVAEIFSCGSVLQNRTLFAGISLLPGGSLWSFTAGGCIGKEKYFGPKTWEQQETLNSREFYPRLKEVFARILPKYLDQGEAGQVAMSLTAGLDGRTIMACAKPAPGELPCYTFGGPYRACADVRLARRIALHCGQSHRTIEVGGDFLAEFPTLAAKAVFISDGTMDVTGAVELYANRVAKQVAPVRLTGNYGSEICRGNVAFRARKLAGAFLAPDFAQLVRTACTTYENERRCHPLSFIAFKQVPWHHYSRLSVEQSQLTVRSPYLDNELVKLMYQAPTGLHSSSELFFQLIHEANPLLSKLPTDRGLTFPKAPFFSRVRNLLAEFTVKAEYAFDYGMPHGLAEFDRLFARLHLERLFLGRHKFFHFRIWYRDHLARYLKEILLDARSLHRDYLQGKVLEDMINAHTAGRQNWTQEIHRVLTLELLQRRLIDRC